MQPLRVPREHPGPDTHRAVGNRAPASPCAHLPPPTSHPQPQVLPRRALRRARTAKSITSLAARLPGELRVMLQEV